MKAFLKRFWPWKRIAELEREVETLGIVIDGHKQSAEAMLRDEQVAHRETKQHLKAARDAHESANKSLRKVTTIMALKAGFK